MLKRDPKTGQVVDVNYTERYDLFKDEDFKQSSMSPGIYFNCVQVANRDGVIALRSSYDSQKRTVFFDEKEWKSFIAGVKNGEFDFNL